MTIYIVPVSGGKDSQLTLSEAIEEQGRENIRCIHNFTGIDHPLTYQHMEWMSKFYGVEIEHTSNSRYKDMWDLLDKKTMIPGRLARFCTDELKIVATNQWLDRQVAAGIDLADLVFLMGMRANESAKRRERYSELTPQDEFSLCDLNPKHVPVRFRPVRVRLPIVDMSTPAVFETLRARGEKINPLYARGHKRVGCYPCILAGPSDYRLAARDPVGRETIIQLRDFRALLVESNDRAYAAEVFIPHDLDRILDEADRDPFGFVEVPDEDDGAGCQWCQR